jgi:hypothetical protein
MSSIIEVAWSPGSRLAACDGAVDFLGSPIRCGEIVKYREQADVGSTTKRN